LRLLPSEPGSSPAFLRRSGVAGLALLCLSAAACSPKRAALESVADALSDGSGGSFGRDDDPELVADAVPFALKTMESLADELDDHTGIRLGLARGFTQYAYAFVQQPAAELEDKDPAEAKRQRERAAKLFLRARDAGLEGLFLAREITLDDLRGPKRDEHLARLRKEDVPLLYWTLAPWAGALALRKTSDMQLVGDVPLLGAMLDRALALDEAYDLGALHEFSLSFDPARSGGTTTAVQKQHFDRALELSRGLRVSPQVTWVEAVVVPAQDGATFERMLNEVLAFDVDKPGARDQRLANVLAQRRARWLLAHREDLINE
jgi:predicted anti-sigma-YlaC factor YlaD